MRVAGQGGGLCESEDIIPVGVRPDYLRDPLLQRLIPVDLCDAHIRRVIFIDIPEAEQRQQFDAVVLRGTGQRLLVVKAYLCSDIEGGIGIAPVCSIHLGKVCQVSAQGFSEKISV